MKKLLSILLAFVLLVSAGCAKKPVDKKAEDSKPSGETVSTDMSVFDVPVTPEMKESAKTFSVRLITDTGGIDDRSFNQGTWEGVQKFSELTGAKINYTQSNSDADYNPNLTTAAQDKYNLIIATGFLFFDSITQVAKVFPEQHFLLIDEVVEAPNVASAKFAEEEGSFLVGVAAGQTAKEAGKKKVGFIGGADFDLIQKFEAGFEAGVKAVDSSIEVMIEYVGDFADAGKAKVLAKKMYDDGAYVIYHAAGGAGNGLFNEANERSMAGEKVWVIGVDRDQYDQGIYDKDKSKSCTLTSMVKRVDVASFTASLMDLKGEFPGGKVLMFDTKNGGIDLPASNPNMSDEAISLVKQYKEKIKSGELKAPVQPNRLKK